MADESMTATQADQILDMVTALGPGAAQEETRDGGAEGVAGAGDGVQLRAEPGESDVPPEAGEGEGGGDPDPTSDGGEPGEEESEAGGSELTALMELVRSLKDEIAELKGTKEAPPAEPAAPVVEDFLGDGEVDEWFESKEKINELLHKVQKKTQEDMLRAMPQLVNGLVQQQIYLHEKSRTFYAENKELTPHADTVRKIASELSKANPGWDIDKLYAETATKAYDTLKLKKEALRPATPQKPRGFAPAGKGPRPSAPPSPDPLLQQLGEMASIVGRT